MTINALQEHTFWTEYNLIKYERFSGRYLHPSALASAINSFNDIGHVDAVGYSVAHRDIWSITLGSGSQKVLAWSQMHGNESTTTKAVFDILSLFKNFKGHADVEELLSKITLKIIPQLNPDGCEAYTRSNHNGIDLNRDAQALTQPESVVLKQVYDNFKPSLCLNLHDQRTIYNVANSLKSAALSFLAPSADEERTITPARIIAMQHIAGIHEFLKKESTLKDMVGRYDDSFNLNCIGDTLQYYGTPTILFEAGHYPNDYMREETRRYVYASLLKSLFQVADGTHRQFSARDYDAIPQNDKKFYDVIIRNVLVNKTLQDVAIQYEEVLINKSVIFKPYIIKIGKLLMNYGHIEHEGKGNKLKINGGAKVKEGLYIEQALINSQNIDFQ